MVTPFFHFGPGMSSADTKIWDISLIAPHHWLPRSGWSQFLWILLFIIPTPLKLQKQVASQDGFGQLDWKAPYPIKFIYLQAFLQMSDWLKFTPLMNSLIGKTSSIFPNQYNKSKEFGCLLPFHLGKYVNNDLALYGICSFSIVFVVLCWRFTEPLPSLILLAYIFMILLSLNLSLLTFSSSLLIKSNEGRTYEFF